MKVKELTINRFDGGKAFSNRDVKSNEFGASINFDIYENPKLLTPVRAYEADEGFNGSATGIRASDLACFGQVATSTIFGVGRKANGTGRKVYSKSLSDDTWTAATASDSSASESSSGCAVPGFFVEQRDSSNQSLYWFVTGHASTPSTSFWTLGLTSFLTSTPTNFGKKTLAFNPTIYPQGILGPDVIVYISDDNKIHACNPDGTVSDSVFTVSRSYTITSLALYGPYLAMSIYGRGRSKVVLWDYNSAQSTETIEWGEGALMVLENLDNSLVGVTDKYINSTLFGSGVSGDGVMQIKVWRGGFVHISEVRAAGSVARAIEQFKYVKNNVLYWYAKIPKDSAGLEYEEGIWAFGKRKIGQPYAVSLHRELPGTFEGFWGISSFLYFPHSLDGHVSRTSSMATYTLTSTYETGIYNDDDSTVDKTAQGAVLSFDSFETGDTVTLKYRKDGATSWTTLDPSPAVAAGDFSATYEMSFHFKEIEFRIETTGGLKPIGFRFRCERLTNAIE